MGGKGSDTDGWKIWDAQYEVGGKRINLFPAVSWKADHVLRLVK